MDTLKSNWKVVLFKMRMKFKKKFFQSIGIHQNGIHISFASIQFLPYI